MTSETKHTPGPWTCAKPTRLKQNYISSESGPVAITSSSSEVSRETNLANARLIAAAPDLLVALQAAEEWAEYIEDDENRVPVDVRLAMRAAIAKATGEG